MKKILYSLIFCSFGFLSHSVFAANEVCTDTFGILHCGAGEVDHIFNLGNVILSGTHIDNGLSVTGNVQADNTEVGSVNITGNTVSSHMLVHNALRTIGIFHVDNSQFDSKATITGDVQGGHNVFNADTSMTGDVTLSSETFKGLSTITGKVYAELSQFSGVLTLNACQAEFSQSSTSQIQMTRQRDCPDDVEKLYLKAKTIVNGNITFTGGNGQVYLSKDSLIKGQVTGGTVIHS